MFRLLRSYWQTSIGKFTTGALSAWLALAILEWGKIPVHPGYCEELGRVPSDIEYLWAAWHAPSPGRGDDPEKRADWHKDFDQMIARARAASGSVIGP